MTRVLTLNLQHGRPGAGAALDPVTSPLAGADIRDAGAAREVLAALADQLRALAPDVIALQEVDLGQARSGRIDQVAELARHLGWTHHRFAAAYAGPVAGLRRRPRRSALGSPADDVLGGLRESAGLPPAGFGNALLSRLPVGSWHVRRLGRGPALVTRRGEGPAWDPRSYRVHTSTARVMIAATLGAGGALGDAAPDSSGVAGRSAGGAGAGRLAVGSTHLATRSDVATTQLADAWASLTTLPGSHLLAGDLNLRADALARLGTARALGAGDTFPAAGPRHRIDHLLTDPWPLGPDGLPLAPGTCPPPAPLRATAWGARSLVVSDHAAAWVDLEPVSAHG